MVLRRLPPIRLAPPPGSTPTNPARQDRHRLREATVTVGGEERRRLGPGGPCPHCDDIVAVKDLVADNQYSAEANSSAKSRAARPRIG